MEKNNIKKKKKVEGTSKLAVQKNISKPAAKKSTKKLNSISAKKHGAAEKKYLPVGTVILLNNGKKKLMITGFAVSSPNEKEKVWDYCGCMYPEGIVRANEVFLFDHKQIKKVYYLGLEDDEEEKQFKSFLKAQLRLKKQNK